MRKRWRFGLSIIIILALVFFIFLFRGFFYVNLITPIVQVIWPFFNILQVIDQKIYWGMIVATTTILVFWLVLKEKEEDYKSAYYQPNNLDDPILKWENLIRHARNNKDERIVLESRLESLTNSIDTYLNNSISTEVHLPNNKTKIWKQVIRFTIFSKKSKNNNTPRDSDFDDQINKILTSMETKMEIYHDDES